MMRMRNKEPIFFLIVLIFTNFIIIENNFVRNAESGTDNNFITNFSTNTLLSTSDFTYPQHVEPTLAIGLNGELYVGWKEALGLASSGVDVSFTKSLDGGKNWTSPVSMPGNISDSGGKSDPWLQVYKNTVFYSYLDFTSPTNSQVTMARSSDGGATWLTSKASQNIHFADKEAFTISDNGTIYLTYDDVNFQTGLITVKLSKSKDGGKSFFDISSISSLCFEDNAGPYPALSSNESLFVSWLSINDSNNFYGDIFYDHSNNGGKTFSTNKDLNPETEFASASTINGSIAKSSMPVMRFDSNDRLYIAWSEYNTNWKIIIRYSDDFGKHWSPKILINDKNGVDQWEPDMDIDENDNVHIVWLEEENNQYRPYYRMLSFTGKNRSDVAKSTIIPVASSFTSSTFFRPGDYFTIRLDSNDIPHVVWTDGRSGGLDIYYASGIFSKSNPSSPSFSILSVIVTIPIILIFLKKSRIKH